SRYLQEFVIVELPCAQHAGALDAFANYRYQFLVVDCVLEPGPRQIGAFASPSINSVTRRALGFKKTLAIGNVSDRQRGQRINWNTLARQPANHGQKHESNGSFHQDWMAFTPGRR